jgi:hypothetical protein
MVVSLIASKIKPLTLSVHVFALSYAANICIFAISDVLYLLPTKTCGILKVKPIFHECTNGAMRQRSVAVVTRPGAPPFQLGRVETSVRT